MGGRKSRYAEIVVRIVPARSQALAERQTEIEPQTKIQPDNDLEQKRTYNALIYTELEVPGLPPALKEVSSHQPLEIANLPLAGSEEIVFLWGKYRKYQAAFVAGEKAASAKLWNLLPNLHKDGGDKLKKIRSELFEPPPTALQAIFKGELQTKLPVRVWWSSPMPDLTYLPWELFAYGERGEAEKKFSFVRGVPAEPLPKVPISGPLRVAFIHSPQQTSQALLDVMAGFGSAQKVEVIPMTDRPMEALQQAVREGYEIIHLVADGIVSLAQEGILYLRKSPSSDSPQLGPYARRFNRIALNVAKPFRAIFPKWIDGMTDKLYTKLDIETCMPRGLSALLRGSRVTVLSLTPPKTDDKDPVRLDGFLLPSVYKAFAGVGNSPLPLPSIVAPLGAMTEDQQRSFWQAFYPSLAKTRSVEEAVAHGQEAASLAIPMALFLRQRLGHEFVHEQASRATPHKANPTRDNAELEASREFLEQLQAVDSKYKGLEDNVTDTLLVQRESVRQSDLEKDLETWKQPEE